MKADLHPQVQQHLRADGAFAAAAQDAVEQVAQQKGALAPADVQAWLDQMWPDGGAHGGTLDPIGAARALAAFSDRSPPPKAAQLGHSVLSAAHGGLMLRSAAADDGASWTSKIDPRSVDARVAAFEADVNWVLGLDLAEPQQYEQFGQWAGWRGQTYDHGTTWQDGTVRHWLEGTLNRRHGLPKAVMAPLLDLVLTDDATKRPAGARMFAKTAGSAVRATAEREAVFDAFLSSIPKIKERIDGGRTTEQDVLHELEDAMGHPRGAIEPRDLRDTMQEFERHMPDRYHRPPDFDLEAHANELKRGVGNTRFMYADYVAAEVTDRRITHAIIAQPELLDGIQSGKLSFDEAIQQIEGHFGVDPGGLSAQVMRNAISQIPLYLPHRDH